MTSFFYWTILLKPFSCQYNPSPYDLRSAQPTPVSFYIENFSGSCQKMWLGYRALSSSLQKERREREREITRRPVLGSLGLSLEVDARAQQVLHSPRRVHTRPPRQHTPPRVKNSNSRSKHVGYVRCANRAHVQHTGSNSISIKPSYFPSSPFLENSATAVASELAWLSLDSSSVARSLSLSFAMLETHTS